MPGSSNLRTPSQIPLAKTLHNGEYQVQRVLGRGGMGQVLLATHTTLGTLFAIKLAIADSPLPESVVAELEQVLHLNDIETTDLQEAVAPGHFPLSGGEHTDRFIREALLLARLHHPAIPTLYDYFLEDGYWHLVMDFVPGTPLNVYLNQNAPLQPLEALNYTIQICDVLAYLHQQQPPVVYRDLKPSNIMLMPNGIVMLIDYGIARYYKEEQRNDTTDFGSPGYASPEQYSGGSQTDGRSDLFSLGVILHEMLTGLRLNPSALMRDETRPISNRTSSALKGLINLVTRPEPAHRYQNATLFAQALERVYAIEERAAYEQRLSTIKATATPLPGHTTIREESPRQDLNQKEDGVSSSLAPLSLTSALPSESLLSQVMDTRRQTRHQLQKLHCQATPLPQPASPAPTQTAPRSPIPDIIPAVLSYTVADPYTKEAHKGLRILTVLALVLLLFMLLTASLTYFHISPFTFAPIDNSTLSEPENVDLTHDATWHQLTSPTVPVADNAAIFAESKGRSYIYMTGGYRGETQDPKYDHNLYRYDIVTSRWETAPTDNSTFPGMLNNAIASDTKGNLLFATGYSTDSLTVAPEIHKYHLDDGNLNKQTLPQNITPGFGLAMISDQQGNIYATEGYSKAGDGLALAGTGWYRYNAATGQWQARASLPQGLGYVMLARNSNNDILLLGGSTDAAQKHPSNAIYRYDSAHDSWRKEKATLPIPLSGAASCSPTKGQLAIFGGFDPAKNASLAHAWLFDINTLSTHALPDIPGGGSLLGAAACDAQGHAFLLRGTREPGTPTSDFLQLSLKLPQETSTPDAVAQSTPGSKATSTSSNQQGTPKTAPKQQETQATSGQGSSPSSTGDQGSTSGNPSSSGNSSGQDSSSSTGGSSGSGQNSGSSSGNSSGSGVGSGQGSPPSQPGQQATATPIPVGK